MPQEYYKLREKEGLYEIKNLKEIGKEKILTLQSTTFKDKKGNIRAQLKYSDNEVFDHKKIYLRKW